MTIAVNSSSLIALAKIRKLELLRYDIVIPKAVFDEISKGLYGHALELANERGV